MARAPQLDEVEHAHLRTLLHAARTHVALLRTSAGRTPDVPELITLIGELSTQSPPADARS